MKNLEDVYMAVFWPKGIGKESGYVLAKKGTKAYEQNKGLDINKDGAITKNEAAQKVIDRRKRYEKK